MRMHVKIVKCTCILVRAEGRYYLNFSACKVFRNKSGLSLPKFMQIGLTGIEIYENIKCGVRSAVQCIPVDAILDI